MSTSHHEEIGRAVAADAEAFGFFTSILAGLLIGLGLDAWWGTGPALTIAGIILGSVNGFMRMRAIAYASTNGKRVDES